MWLLFAVLSLLAFAAGDLLGKKKVDIGSETAPVEMLLSVLLLAFFISLVLGAFAVGESGEAPWRILWKHPLILVNQFCFLTYWLLYLVSFRYIGLALEAAVSGTKEILYFGGLLLVHTFCGKLASFHEILHPVRLIPVLLVLTFVCLFPNVELLAHRTSDALRTRLAQERHRTVAGLLFLLTGLVFDAGETLLTTVILDEGKVGFADFLTASYFSTILPILLFLLYLRKVKGTWFIPFKDGGKYTLSYCCVAFLSSLLYLYASSLNAVKTGILFMAEPITPILCARLILKEKYTWRQNLCIWGIVASAITFCAADYLL